jgi:hypothetical protein
VGSHGLSTGNGAIGDTFVRNVMVHQTLVFKVLLSAGINQTVRKPMDPDALIKTILKVLTKPDLRM